MPSLKPWVGVIHELPLPKVSYLNPAMPKREKSRSGIFTWMKQPQTPQAKKRLSLLKDCQNTYGENDKSSRTAIRWRKRWVNSTYRRDVNQMLGETTTDFDRLTDRAKTIERHPWQKCADLPLGKKILHDRTRAVIKLLSKTADRDRDYLAKLERYLAERDLKSGQVSIILRRVRAVVLDRNSATLDLALADLNLLEDFLALPELGDDSIVQSTP
jgi:hypothetical protein